LIKAGQLRVLAVTSAERTTAFPDVPAIAEAGVPGFEAASWQMVVAPAKTPQSIVQKLHNDLTSVLAEPEIKDQNRRRRHVAN
jgi:tripartite-type tricarboxylate transporter receptor subunit TctC